MGNRLQFLTKLKKKLTMRKIKLTLLKRGQCEKATYFLIQLYNILEKSNLWKWWKDQWCPWLKKTGKWWLSTAEQDLTLVSYGGYQTLCICHTPYSTVIPNVNYIEFQCIKLVHHCSKCTILNQDVINRKKKPYMGTMWFFFFKPETTLIYKAFKGREGTTD